MMAEERFEADPAYLRLHLPEPDYIRPLLEIPEEPRRQIARILSDLYGREAAGNWFPEVERLMQVYYAHKPDEMIAEDQSFDPAERFTQEDVILITYGDLVVAEGEPPLQVLARVLNAYSRNLTTVHLLPFFPSSSDRGFSIIDFEEVDPHLGTWQDIEQLALHYRLMFDGVINHVSAKSRWFQEYLNGNPEYSTFFIGFSTRSAVSKDHLNLIMRPRTSQLLTEFQTIRGPRYLWTTFSPDQVDLNYHSPKVLLRMIDVLLFYVRRGADLIRLDAVTYLWHELGTQCALLEQTHAIIQLFRIILDVVAPRVGLVSETNVAHEDNISYFGDGGNEAQMIYNFALPPLVLHTMHTGNCERLSQWAATLERPSDRATYFNFLDSHDGIGLLGVRGILSEEQIDAMIEVVTRNGGLVSYRSGDHGQRAPYELNVTWWSAMNRAGSDESVDLQVDRYIASRSIALALRGVPGVYLLGMIGSVNDPESVTATGEARSINRRAMNAVKLEEMLSQPGSTTGRIASRMAELLEARVHRRAFHPNADQRVIAAGNAVFALLRIAPEADDCVLALTNVSDSPQEVVLGENELGDRCGARWKDLLSDRRLRTRDRRLCVSLEPYRVCWLVPDA
jgi:sucrose phosphorylase